MKPSAMSLLHRLPHLALGWPGTELYRDISLLNAANPADRQFALTTLSPGMFEEIDFPRVREGPTRS